MLKVMKRIFKASIILLAVVAAAVALAVFTRVPVPRDAAGKIRIYTRNKPDVELETAVVSGSTVEIRAFGHDAKPVEPSGRSYKIGHLGDTFTGELIANGVIEGNIGLNSPVSDYLAFTSNVYAPSIFELLTHTSAYGNYGAKAVAREDVISAVENFRLNANPPYLYSFSELGMRILKLVLEPVYAADINTVYSDFIGRELGLEHTSVTVESAESTLEDLITYSGIVMNPDKEYFKMALRPLIEVNMETNIAYVWNVDENGVIGCGGSTAGGASQMLVDRKSGTAVIVLSNYADDKYGSVADIASAIMQEALQGP